MTTKIEVRVGSVEDLRQDVNRIFDNPKSADNEPDHVIYLSPRDVPKFLSEERIRLIHEMRKGDYTINQLAIKLKRKRENVSRDINLLKHLKLVDVKKNGREIHPVTKPNITITI